MKKIITKIVNPKSVGNSLNLLSFISPKKTGAIAYKLFCSPRTGREVLPEYTETMMEAEQNHHIINNTKIVTYHWKGTRETVLLNHGWESNASRWKELIELLKERSYNIIAVDAPAHGLSGGSMITGISYSKVVQAISKKYKPNVVIGHSLGALATLYCYTKLDIKTPEYLICISTPSRLLTLSKHFYDILGLNKRAIKSTEKHFKKVFGFTMGQFVIHDFVKTLKTKGLLIHDQNDDITPLNEAREILSNWKNATLFITKGFGHSVKDISVFSKIIYELDNLKPQSY